jgi:opacity protein-like surface antigen
MKKYVILFLIGLILTSFSTVSALDLKGKFALTGIGNLALPMGDFGDEADYEDELAEKGSAKLGFGFGGNFEYFVTDNIAIGGNFTWRKYGMKTENLKEALESEVEEYGLTAEVDGHHTITSFGVFGKYVFTIASPKMAPYVKFGLGKGKVKSVIDWSAAASYEGETYKYEYSLEADVESRTYVDMGGGILYELSENIAFTGEVLYTHLMSDKADLEVDWEEKYSYPGGSEQYKGKEKDELQFNADNISAFVGLTFFFGGTK